MLGEIASLPLLRPVKYDHVRYKCFINQFYSMECRLLFLFFKNELSWSYEGPHWGPAFIRRLFTTCRSSISAAATLFFWPPIRNVWNDYSIYKEKDTTVDWFLCLSSLVRSLAERKWKWTVTRWPWHLIGEKVMKLLNSQLHYEDLPFQSSLCFDSVFPNFKWISYVRSVAAR
jgi:hypothetical protein